MVVKKLIPFFLIIFVLALFFYKQRPQKNDLTIYSYSSFAASWGVGPQIIAEFQKLHNVSIRQVDVGDANTILQRLELEKNNPRADIVIGLDQLSLTDAQAFNWKNISTDIKFDSQIELQVKNLKFMAFDWAPLTFVYRAGEVSPPLTLNDLIKTNYKKEIILFDPQMSAPGFIFFNWIIQVLGKNELKNYFEKLKLNILTITPSWSMGYGLFKKKQAKLVFSYVTSPVYHWVNEHDESYQAAMFQEPVPYQIEYAAILDSTKNEELAKKFISFLVSSDIQKKIMFGNYMLPVVEGIRQNTVFDKLPTLKLYQSGEINKKQILELWKTLR